MIKCWAKAQHVIALSSGEAELYACVKASSETLGVKALMIDMGFDMSVNIQVDANAAIGMIMKEGLSGVRHLDTQFLWIQEYARKGKIVVNKVDGKENMADMFTKALGSKELYGHMRNLGFWGRQRYSNRSLCSRGASMEGCRCMYVNTSIGPHRYPGSYLTRIIAGWQV